MLAYYELIKKLALRSFDKFMSGSNELYQFDCALLAEIYGVNPEIFWLDFELAYKKVSDEHYGRYSNGLMSDGLNAK